MATFRNGARPWALVPLRVVMGFGFLAHGWAKWHRGPAGFGRLLEQVGVPAPAATAWMVTLLEVFGGLALIAGVAVAVVSVPLIISMVAAMATVNGRYGFSSVNTIGLTPDGPVFGPPGYEINLLYAAGLLALILAGPGPWSVDAWLERRRPPAPADRRQGGAMGDWAPHHVQNSSSASATMIPPGPRT